MKHGKAMAHMLNQTELLQTGDVLWVKMAETEALGIETFINNSCFIQLQQVKDEKQKRKLNK